MEANISRANEDNPMKDIGVLLRLTTEEWIALIWALEFKPILKSRVLEEITVDAPKLAKEISDATN